CLPATLPSRPDENPDSTLCHTSHRQNPCIRHTFQTARALIVRTNEWECHIRSYVGEWFPCPIPKAPLFAEWIACVPNTIRAALPHPSQDAANLSLLSVHAGERGRPFHAICAALMFR